MNKKLKLPSLIFLSVNDKFKLFKRMSLSNKIIKKINVINNNSFKLALKFLLSSR